MDTPKGFLRCLKKKTAARIDAVFGTLIHASFPHTLCKFQTQATQGQVIRSHQVASPQKKFARHSYTESPITLELSAIDIRNGIYEMFISEF